MKVKDLKRGLKKIQRTNSDYLITLKNFFHPPQRSILIKNSKEFEYSNKNFLIKRTQDLKKYYHDAGAFYIYKTSSLNKSKINKTYIILKKFSFFDIDDIDDYNFVKKFKINTF